MGIGVGIVYGFVFGIGVCKVLPSEKSVINNYVCENGISERGRVEVELCVCLCVCSKQSRTRGRDEHKSNVL